MKCRYTFFEIAMVAAFAWALTAASVSASPVPGTYNSTDLGGQILPGRASTWRTGINSGLPHVLHAQSWDGSLGSQWTIDCPVENAPFLIQDNRVNGTGTVVYTSTFNGGTFTFLPGGWPWGDGTGVLGQTTMITTVQFVNNVPYASVVNSNTSGIFSGGCSLTFAISNGYGVGETTSLDPSIVKPATYPTFLDALCGPAPADQQFGTWGNVITITMHIDCPVPAEESTWGAIKARYF